MKMLAFCLMVFLVVANEISRAASDPKILVEVEAIALTACYNADVIQDRPSVVDVSLGSKLRIAQLGDAADFAIAEIIIEGLREWRTRVPALPTTEARVNASALMKAVRNDPKLRTLLMPAYVEWLDAVGREQLTHPDLSITEEAAIFVKLWGDELSRQKLSEQTALLSKSSNPNLPIIAQNLRMILDDKRSFELPPAPKTAFHQWCKESAAAINADRAPSAARSQALKPIQPSIATQSPPALNPKPAPTTKAPEAKPVATSEEPTSSTPWSVVAVLIVAAIGLLWLLLMNRR